MLKFERAKYLAAKILQRSRAARSSVRVWKVERALKSVKSWKRLEKYEKYIKTTLKVKYLAANPSSAVIRQRVFIGGKQTHFIACSDRQTSYRNWKINRNLSANWREKLFDYILHKPPVSANSMHDRFIQTARCPFSISFLRAKVVSLLEVLPAW